MYTRKNYFVCYLRTLPTQFGFRQTAPQFLVIKPHGAFQMPSAYGFSFLCRQICCVHDNFPYCASRNLKFFSQKISGKRSFRWRFFRNHGLPHDFSHGRVRKWKTDHKTNSPFKCIIHVVDIIGCQNRYSVIVFKTLQKVTSLHIRIPVIGRAHGRTLCKQSVRFIEKKHRISSLCLIKKSRYVLFCLSDIFTDNP